MDIERDLVKVEAIRRRLDHAIRRGRSEAWILRLWAQFIKARDLYRCLCCSEQKKRIHAHHIVRKSLYRWGAFEIGNGITLCEECHKRVHELFNRRPDLSLPIGAEQGDDQDEWAFLFGLLRDDAAKRGLPEDEFYAIGDHMLKFFVRCQGYRRLYERAVRGEIGSVTFAHEIWRLMPEEWYTNLGAEVIRLNA